MGDMQQEIIDAQELIDAYGRSLRRCRRLGEAIHEACLKQSALEEQHSDAKIQLQSAKNALHAYLLAQDKADG